MKPVRHLTFTILAVVVAAGLLSCRGVERRNDRWTDRRYQHWEQKDNRNYSPDDRRYGDTEHR